MKFGRNKPDDSADQQTPQMQKGIEVAKVELSGGVIKFFVAKGRGKKQWVAAREIPVSEVESIEKFGTELKVTWKGTADTFFTREKNDLFGEVADQVNQTLEQKRKSAEEKEKAAKRKTDLFGVVSAALGVTDLSFNVLTSLQEKRINWQLIEEYAKGLSDTMNYTAQTLPPLKLDFSKIVQAAQTQVAKEASNEAFNLLKAEFGYFDGLNFEDDIKGNHPNIHDVKSMISAYFMLNDLLLGKVVGDKDSKEETSQLEAVLLKLAAETSFKVNVDELKDYIGKIDPNADKKKVIDKSRAVFKEQIKQLNKPVVAPIVQEPTQEPVQEPMQEPPQKPESAAEPVIKEETIPESVPKVEVSSEPVSKPEVVAEPVSKEETIQEPISKVEVSTEPISREETIAEPVPKKEVNTEPITESGKKEKDIPVSKVEVSDNIVRFFAAKGLFGKQWIIVKEFPLLEIEHIEKFGKELSVTWKGAIYTFFSKEKTDIFRPLVDQVNRILEGATSETSVAPTVSAELIAKSEVTNEPILKDEAGTDPVSKDDVAETATKSDATESETSPTADNQPASEARRQRLRRNRKN